MSLAVNFLQRAEAQQRKTFCFNLISLRDMCYESFTRSLFAVKIVENSKYNWRLIVEKLKGTITVRLVAACKQVFLV